ncbi:unnamed protein product, partial [Pylaiella littoralis]
AAQNVNIVTGENPWTEPPADVLELGMAYAARFLKDLNDFGGTSSNRLKVVLVGLGNAGKTSAAVRLEGLASSQPLPTAEERTVGVEIRDIQLGPGQANGGSRGNTELDVTLWDFAGQRAYYDTHQMFLTPGALFVLVVDVFAYSEDGDGYSREDALEQWLDILQARVPSSVVLLVGTHSDLFGSPADCGKRVKRILEGGVERHLRKGQEEVATSFNHQIQQLGQDMSRKLDCIAAVTSKFLLVSVEKDIPCPRLIMVSENVSPLSALSRLSHFR